MWSNYEGVVYPRLYSQLLTQNLPSWSKITRPHNEQKAEYYTSFTYTRIYRGGEYRPGLLVHFWKTPVVGLPAASRLSGISP